MKRAVIVVGGCKGSARGKAEEEGDDVGNIPDGVGTWRDGGDVSGKVVKRIPVETNEVVN